MKEHKIINCIFRLQEGYNQNINRLLGYIEILDKLIIELDQILDIHQPILIGRGRVRLENYYFKFYKQIKLNGTDKWIFLRIPSDHLLNRINRDCLNEVTKPIFKQLIKTVDERNNLYKMLSLFNRNMNLLKEPESILSTKKLSSTP
jgi:hypothetical protein